jgi:3-polyprenyl-4-hydroxybenzoate decarboxylase
VELFAGDPSFYSNPSTVEEVALTVVHRVIDLSGLDLNSFRWGQKESKEIDQLAVLKKYSLPI